MGVAPDAARLDAAAIRCVAIFRALQLGDLLCAAPALRALRLALPQARITLIGLPWAQEFAQRFSHLLDGFIAFPGHPGLPEQTPRLEAFPEFLKQVQTDQLDLVIQMHGNGVLTNPLVSLLGARRQAGYHVPGQYCPEPGLFLPYPEGEPEVWRHLRLMEYLGFPPCGEELEFPITPADHEALGGIPAARSLRAGRYICLHPGARSATRRWPLENFARVARELARDGYPLVITGSSAERELGQRLTSWLPLAIVDLTGQTSLGALAVLLQGARLLICNDTGVSHLAAALRVPSVVVFHQLSERQGWPPLDRLRHRVVCRFDGVTPAAVVNQARDLLRQPLGADRDLISVPQGSMQEEMLSCVACGS